jgi:hypothetical protein
VFPASVEPALNTSYPEIKGDTRLIRAFRFSMAGYPLHPKHPDRICWGCEKLCPANDLRCGKERAPHPCEDSGDGWYDAETDRDLDPGLAGGATA